MPLCGERLKKGSTTCRCGYRKTLAEQELLRRLAVAGDHQGPVPVRSPVWGRKRGASTWITAHRIFRRAAPGGLRQGFLRHRRGHSCGRSDSQRHARHRRRRHHRRHRRRYGRVRRKKAPGCGPGRIGPGRAARSISGSGIPAPAAYFPGNTPGFRSAPASGGAYERQRSGPGQVPWSATGDQQSGVAGPAALSGPRHPKLGKQRGAGFPRTLDGGAAGPHPPCDLQAAPKGKLARLLGRDGFSSEDPEFDKRFSVQCGDPAAAQALLSPQVMEQLLHLGKVYLSVKADGRVFALSRRTSRCLTPERAGRIR